MTFNKDYMIEKTNKFWEAYFKGLELLDGDRGKPIEETPVVREIPIDDNFSFIIGRIRASWELGYRPTGTTWLRVTEINDATRASELLADYVYSVV